MLFWALVGIVVVTSVLYMGVVLVLLWLAWGIWCILGIDLVVGVLPIWWVV